MQPADELFQRLSACLRRLGRTQISLGVSLAQADPDQIPRAPVVGRMRFRSMFVKVGGIVEWNERRVVDTGAVRFEIVEGGKQAEVVRDESVDLGETQVGVVRDDIVEPDGRQVVEAERK